MEDKYREEIFEIPANYKMDGAVKIGGHFLNPLSIAEAVIWMLIWIMVIKSNNLSTQICMYILGLTGAVGLFLLVGIEGDSVSEYLLNKRRQKKQAKLFTEPTMQEVQTMERKKLEIEYKAGKLNVKESGAKNEKAE